MKRRLASRIRWSLFLALAAATSLIYCASVAGPWWTITGSAVTFFIVDCYFGVAICQWTNFDDAVYDCQIPLTLVEPMAFVNAPDSMFGHEYWTAFDEQLRRGEAS